MAEAAPVIRGDLECPRYAWQTGQMRYALDSIWNQQSSGTSGPWARVGTQRCPKSESRSGHWCLRRLSACNDARRPKATGATPMIRNDPECPRYAWHAGQRRHAPDSAWNQPPSGTSGPWARVGTQRRPKSESRTGHWRLRRLSACNGARCPKATGAAPMIRNDPECSSHAWWVSRGTYASDFTRGQQAIGTSGYWAPLRAGRLACIHRPAGAMSRHRPRLAPGIGRGTR